MKPVFSLTNKKARRVGFIYYDVNGKVQHTVKLRAKGLAVVTVDLTPVRIIGVDTERGVRDTAKSLVLASRNLDNKNFHNRNWGAMVIESLAAGKMIDIYLIKPNPSRLTNRQLAIKARDTYHWPWS